MTDKPTTPADIPLLVRDLIREGRIEAAIGQLHSGSATEAELAEELRIYQAELLLQNEQLRAAESAAERALEHFVQLFRTHPEPVLLVDEEGLIVECNDAAARLFGIDQRGGLHMFLAQRLAASSRSAFGRSLTDAARGGVQVLTQVALHAADGDTAACWDLRISGVPGDAGSIPRCAVVLIDQSRLLLRQDQLSEQIERQAGQLAEVHTEALASATAHARIAVRLIGELQEPLQRVSRYARSLHDVMPRVSEPAGAFGRSQVDGIIDGANAMLRIVADLGQVVQAESGLLQLRCSRVEVGVLIREACRAEAWVLDRGRKFAPTGSSEPIMLMADSGLLMQVVRMLLRKVAAHAVAGSTIKVHWATACADIDLPERVSVSIERVGAQRSPAAINRMFSLFSAPVAAGEPADHEHLAMMSCRVMVEMHAGRIWAANTATGMTVNLWLPQSA